MIVADNRAYDYRREYLEDIPLEQPQKQPVVKPQKKAKPKTKSHIVSILFIFSISILIISRYAMIAELGFQYRGLKEDYKEILKEQTDLNVELMKTVNLDTLEKTAIEQLGMQYPDVNAQIIYVNAAVASTTDANYNSYSDKAKADENKYIVYVKNFMAKLLTILE